MAVPPPATDDDDERGTDPKSSFKAKKRPPLLDETAALTLDDTRCDRSVDDDDDDDGDCDYDGYRSGSNNNAYRGTIRTTSTIFKDFNDDALRDDDEESGEGTHAKRGPKRERASPLPDCYSVLALSGPVYRNYDGGGIERRKPRLEWSGRRRLFWCCGLLPILLQATLLILLVVGAREGDVYDDHEEPGRPAAAVRAAKVAAVWACLVAPRSGPREVVGAWASPTSRWWQHSGFVRGSSLARALMGLLSTLAAVASIVACQGGVVDVLAAALVAAAVTRVQDAAFAMAARGDFGSFLRRETGRVLRSEPASAASASSGIAVDPSRRRRGIAVALLVVLACGLVAVAAVWLPRPPSNGGVRVGVAPAPSPAAPEPTGPSGSEAFDDERVGDGVCDEALNTPENRYDGGDCCAATCTGSACGDDGAVVFGSPGFGFPGCVDPATVSLSISIRGLTSSRDPSYFSEEEFASSHYGYADEGDWRAMPPLDPYLLLECDGTAVLSVRANPAMVNRTATVRVGDGARCALTVRNTIAGGDDDHPIWYVDYAVSRAVHRRGDGDDDDEEEDSLFEMFAAGSGDVETVEFTVFPACSIDRILDAWSAVSSTPIDLGGPFPAALEWLAANDDDHDDDADRARCDYDDTFAERAALVALDIAATAATTTTPPGGDRTEPSFADPRGQCLWPFAMCNERGRVTRLDLSGWNLGAAFRVVPADVFRLFDDLVSLELEGTRIASVPTGIASLTGLERLSLGRNVIEIVPTEIGSMTGLRELDLASNRLSSLPSEIGLLTGLTGLSSPFNEIASIPSEFGSLTGLITLDVGDNRIASIPDEIGSLSSLTGLTLYSNRISSFPDAIGSMTSLKTLLLDNNRIRSIPSGIGRLTKLEGVFLYNNQITSVATEIGLLTELEMCFAARNQIASLPSEIGSLSRLRYLYLDNNRIASVPSEIGLLDGLERIALDGNNVTSVPTEIGRLTDLKGFSIYDNGISSIPSEIGSMTALEYTFWGGNRIGSIPTEIGYLTSLLNLDLGGNEIRSMPTEMGSMAALYRLILEDNRIESVPSDIRLMTSLEELSLNGNRLVSVPTEIGALERLVWLDLDRNRLLSLPTEIGSMPNLSYLFYEDNPLEAVPEEIREMCGDGGTTSCGGDGVEADGDDSVEKEEGENDVGDEDGENDDDGAVVVP